MKKLTKKQQARKERVELKRSKGCHTRWKAIVINKKHWLHIVDMLRFADELTTCNCSDKHICRESSKTLINDCKDVDNWVGDLKNYVI